MLSRLHSLMLSICYAIYVESTLTSWNISNTTLPIGIAEHACGFDPITNNIFLYFGTNITASHNAYSYNIDTHSISSYPSITSLTGMFYSTGYIGSPFWYFLLNDAFGQFNPASLSITYPLSWKNNQALTSTGSADQQYGCVVISLHQNNIIVTGGFDDINTISKMQIYNTTSETWHTGPDMNYSRDSHGCIISKNNYLYVIGGYTLTPQQDAISNIEKIDVSNINNLLPWISQTDDEYQLTVKKFSMNCVLYGDNIYVIGGHEYGNGFALTQVDIIDTKTDLVIAGPPLPIDIYSTCAVIVNEMIYILGGYSDQGTIIAVNKIIISNYLNGTRTAKTNPPTTNVPTTFNPTTFSPTTLSPTTDFPTFIPTTIAPTTNNPTVQPISEKPVIPSTAYITTSSIQDLQHNDTGLELEIILLLIGIVLFIGIVGIILYCVYRNKKAKQNKDETVIETTTHVEMQKSSSEKENITIDRMTQSEGNNVMDTVSNQPLDMITSNGTALQLGSDKNTDSDELHPGTDDDLYSDGCGTSGISTPQYEIPKGNHKVETTTRQESDDDMYTEVNIVTEGAFETPQDKNQK